MKKDWHILRELGKKVAEIAALPIQQETIALWKSLNSLKQVRPMVIIDLGIFDNTLRICWHELDVDNELILQCEDNFCRQIEVNLRRTLYAWNHMRVDMVVEPCIDIPKVILGIEENLGIDAEENTAETDQNSYVKSHHYHDIFPDEAELEKIQVPTVIYDRETTARREAVARDILDNIIEVRMQGHFPRFTIWDRIVEWRGAENVFADLVNRPKFMHKLMNRATEAYLCRLDQLEEKGLLGYGQGIIRSSGAYTDELPAQGFTPHKPRAKDIWTGGMAQLFTAVSPQMHREFELSYANRWYERFGLVYYGCCEALHDKMDDVVKIPNLRKVSMSPWVNQEAAAQKIQDRFVFSRKPNPVYLGGSGWNAEAVKKDLQITIDICKAYNCPLEFVLQDVSTVQYDPKRMWEWARAAMEVVSRNYP